MLSAIPQCAVSSLSPIRYADPGEFTRRAFYNNRLDLSQVESLSDTLSAETEQQRRVAVKGSDGSVGRTYEGWRKQLLYARGELEALIDFSEDQHFDESPSELMANVRVQVEDMKRSIEKHELGSRYGELLKRGIKISLLGPPNAGKSSLLNRIVGREASIVSQEAGTTRDIVEVGLDIRGYFCTFADTAGLRTGAEGETIGAIEEEGIRRAKAKASESDVLIAMASVEPSTTPSGWTIRYDDSAMRMAAEAKRSLFVVNKCDSVAPDHLSRLIQECISTVIQGEARLLTISCRDAQVSLATTEEVDPGNIHQFVSNLVEIFQDLTSLPGEVSEELLGVTERQRQLLSSCRGHLNDFISEADRVGGDSDIVLAAEHLRSAANDLARIIGRGEAGDVEEVLGVVFEK